MSTTMTEQDLSFITFLEKNLHQNLFYVSLSEDKKTFNWVDSKPEGQNYKEQMVNFLIQDLKNGTTSYNYNVFNSTNVYPSYIIEALLSSHKRSVGFILRMFDLFGQQETHFFDKILSTANEYGNSELVLGILKKGYHYGKVENIYSNTSTVTLMHSYSKIISLKTITNEELEANFLEHIHNSTIDISEAELIRLYVNLFSDKNLDLLYQSFNIQKENHITQVVEKSFSVISLSLKNLMLSHVNYVEEISKHLPILNNAFPKFTIFEQNAYTVDIITPKNELNEKKIVMLFEQLMEMKYPFSYDVNTGYPILLEVSQKINEKVYLDSIVDGKEKRQKNKMKV